MSQSQNKNGPPLYKFFSKKPLTPSEFRKCLERGPVFIKIGQFLALRPDLISQEYCDELMDFFDNVQSFSWDQAQTILTEDLGQDPKMLFVFEKDPPEPSAAGSLAQVYRAFLKNTETKVALKVQRPDLEELIKRDFKDNRLVLENLFWKSGIFTITSPHEVIEELEKWLDQEINFVKELENLDRLHRLISDNSFVKLPQFYPELCTRRVLTIEFLEGIIFNKLLKSDTSAKEKEFAREIDCEQIAKNLIESSLSQIFQYKFFHADLHPGNLFALSDNRIGFVDFGMCDELDEVIRQQHIHYFSTIYSGNIEQIFLALARILIPTEKANFEAFRSDFLIKTRIWIDAKNDQVVNQSGAVSNMTKSPTAQWLIDLMQTARKHGLRVPPKVLSMYRTLLTLEIVTFQLAPKADLGTVWHRFFQKLQLGEILYELIDLKNIQPILLNLATLLRDTPGQLNQILSKISDGSFAINVYTSDTPKVISNRNQQTRILTTSILSVGISLLLTVPNFPIFLGISLKIVLWGTLFLLYISIFIQWRKLN